MIPGTRHIAIHVAAAVLYIYTTSGMYQVPGTRYETAGASKCRPYVDAVGEDSLRSTWYSSSRSMPLKCVRLVLNLLGA